MQLLVNDWQHQAALEYAILSYNLQDNPDEVFPFTASRSGRTYKEQAQDYTDETLVLDVFKRVDSHLDPHEIVEFYQAHGVRFFLFASDNLALSLAARHEGVTAVLAGAMVEYKVEGSDRIETMRSSFVTNLSPDLMVKTAPELKGDIERWSEKPVRKFAKKIKCRCCDIRRNINRVSDAELIYLSDVPLSIKRADAVMVKPSILEVANKKHIKRTLLQVRDHVAVKIDKLLFADRCKYKQVPRK
ncbi:MAG: hypothetical protein ACRCWB_11815 [Enterovibrio sp.]